MSAPPPPAALGRGAVIEPGGTPPAWLADAPRTRVDSALLADGHALRHTTDRLHQRWAARQPYVVELALDARVLAQPSVTRQPLWQLGTDADLTCDRLHWLVWANTYDCRGRQPRWWHAEKARRAGLELVDGGPADVLLDGTPVWIDGGPRGPLPLDEVVVHRDDSGRGRLRRVPSGPPPPFVGLAPDQDRAVRARQGAVRVVAPAGSGKTRVLTARLQHLVDGVGIAGDQVLALAYNTGAAAQLRARCGGRARAVTLHAHALAILRRHRGEVSVLDERERRRLVQRLVRPDHKANTDPIAPYLGALDLVRAALRDPEEIEAEREEVPGLAALVGAYRSALADARAVDFAEMTFAAAELLLADPQARRAEQARAVQVLVDEFQDLTPCYLLLVRLLASPQLAVYGVGDEDQVIYGHAGATPRYLLDFAELFPGAAAHALEVNYRCPPGVVAAARQLLDRNGQRTAKVIRPAPGRTADPAAMRIDVAAHSEQASSAADVVERWLAERPATDVAVLARVNVALLPVQVELAMRGVPVSSPIGPELLQRSGVRASLAYLRLATADLLAGADLAEILYRPLRPIPAAFRDHLAGRSWTVEQLAETCARRLHGRAGRSLDRLVGHLGMLRGRAARQPTAEVLRVVRDVVGVGSAAADLDASAGRQIGASHVDDLDALLQIADRCPRARDFEAFLGDVLAHTVPAGQPAVRLSSVHRVKGLQWPCVLLVGASEGLAPHRLAHGVAAIEEERRIWHVAITRAAEELVVVAPTAAPSRFVAEMQGLATPLAQGSAARGTTAARARSSSARGSRLPTVRATAGLLVHAAGGLQGCVETTDAVGAFVRTANRSLLRVRYGDAVNVEGQAVRLARP